MLSVADDGAKLFRDFGIRAHNLVELGALARHVDPPFVAIHKRSLVSLAKLVAHYAGKTLNKGKERTGNWEAPLRENMIDCQLLLFIHCSVYIDWPTDASFSSCKQMQRMMHIVP
jgi:hypothetical protein